MVYKTKHINEDFNFNQIKDEHTLPNLMIKHKTDEIVSYLNTHVARKSFGDQPDIVILFDEHENITKKKFPNGALLIDSEFRVSTFNVPVLTITDNENAKCPIHFYCVETIYFISTSFETTADIDYATFVAYSVGDNFSSVKSLPKICYKFMLQYRNDAK